MARFWVILAVVAVAFIVYSLVDCAMADRARIRGPRKPIWLLLILVLPVIGSLLWFFIGRGRVEGSRRPATRIIAPDDDPTFLAGLRRDTDQDERIRRLEEEFGKPGVEPDRDRGGSTETGGPGGRPGSDPAGGSPSASDRGSDGSEADEPGPSGRRDG